MQRTTSMIAAVLALAAPLAHAAGPYLPTPGGAGLPAIAKNDPAIVSWATGFADYLPGPNVSTTFQTPQKALGAAVGDSFDVVSLGDAGRITLTFGGRIVDGPGADFAVFENSFSTTFLELARVEVSSDGLNFARFPAISFTPAPVGGFGFVDASDIDGFAGKWPQGFGTRFDLQSVAGAPGLDLANVRYVRLIDIVGNGSEFDDYPAAFGGPHPIYDPYPTTGSGGFDLDAVGVMHFAAAPVPEPAQFAQLGAGLVVLAWLKCRRRAECA